MFRTVAEKCDWCVTDMPEKHEVFTFERFFSEEEMQKLRSGNIPMEMDDRWFCNMENDTLFIYRSWTGVCMYMVEFLGETLRVTVNPEPVQHSCTTIWKDAELINSLLDRWCGSERAYAHTQIVQMPRIVQEANSFDQLKIGAQTFPAVYFHKPEEPDGYLSNWAPARFTVDGIEFSSSEQYIMYRKCLLFGDIESARKVLETSDPSQQQAIGRTAKGYLGDVWEQMRRSIAIRGILEKFSQDPALKQKLLDTGDTYLVECARSDRIWACGISLYDDRRGDFFAWRGMNILGDCLMEVRDILKNGSMKG